ncbi:MAG: polymer-forming cytoskeletal protein [Crocinitomicaceae bacterium]|nr:polymer-forming cytoskeletal protein [Crocinitomicaceae bacterium]
MKKKVGVMGDSSPDRLNVIVEGTKIIGDFIAESNVRIDGEIQGNVSSSAKIVIGRTGIINGNLVCADSDVEGKIEGVLKVENLLTLRSTAVVTGEITTAKIQIEEGAEFSGTCKMSNFSSSTTKTIDSAKENTLQEDVVY